MGYGITFSPLVPNEVLWAAIAVAVICAVLLLVIRSRGAWMRALALGFAALALANPSLTRQDREALPSVAVVVVDKSPSQSFGERDKQTEAARAAVTQRLSRIQGLEVRTVEAGAADGETDGTRLFSGLSAALADVPPDRVAGAVFITDGRVHDVPAEAAQLGFTAPVHALITGRPGERDRRIQLVSAPRFGIVGQQQTIVLRVEDQGTRPGPARLTIRRDGELLETRDVIAGEAVRIQVQIPHAGQNIVEVEASPLENELTTINNRAVVAIDGVRDKLRVLLVSGEPHAGERTWRNLLKSDASVDLVHFTILRPPEKQDGTPINELSLIAFPTRELFVDKIKDFDLIIFDRYQHRGVLPLLYYDYIAQYVDNGGALLIAAGPEHAGPDSIALTPLSTVLPATPTGEMIEKAFYPRLSEEGRKHPVTRGLDGSGEDPPHWGRWFRSVDVERPQGETIMLGADNHPLLVLNRAGQGRVAMLLSDQGWLWARGFEGGGPNVSLYRRIAHWLMKEPALEEEALTARASGRTLEVTRQTIGDNPGNATVRYPSGKTETLPLTQSEPGLYKAEKRMDEIGLFEVRNGKLSTLVHIGAVDAPEFKAMISTTDVLQPVADRSKGLVTRVSNANGAISVPPILPVRGQVRVSDNDRMMIRMTSETVLKGINTLPLFAGFAGVGILLLAFGAMWWREGR